jgi:histidyl-tRNA synthetase
MGINHVINPNLVRGLDYYTRTTFEVTSEHLGAQKAVSAGGRYDGLVGEFGGPPTPAIGFAMGMERLTALLKEETYPDGPGPAVFIATLGEEAGIEGMRIAEELRKAGHRVEPNYGGASLKSQLRKADRLFASYALIIGDEELKAGMIKWKHLKKGEQGEVPFSSLLSLIGEGGR